MAAAAKKMVIERFSVARMMQDVLTEYRFTACTER